MKSKSMFKGSIRKCTKSEDVCTHVYNYNNNVCDVCKFVHILKPWAIIQQLSESSQLWSDGVCMSKAGHFVVVG